MPGRGTNGMTEQLPQEPSYHLPHTHSMATLSNSPSHYAPSVASFAAEQPCAPASPPLRWSSRRCRQGSSRRSRSPSPWRRPWSLRRRSPARWRPPLRASWRPARRRSRARAPPRSRAGRPRRRPRRGPLAWLCRPGRGRRRRRRLPRIRRHPPAAPLGLRRPRRDLASPGRPGRRDSRRVGSFGGRRRLRRGLRWRARPASKRGLCRRASGTSAELVIRCSWSPATGNANIQQLVTC